MMIYKFRMLSDENDHFVRDYELLPTMSLLELHDFLVEALDYEPCITSFFTANERWERLAEFTTIDMGVEVDEAAGLDEALAAPRPMASVRLCDVLTHMHDRLIYNFDLFASRAYYLELIDAAQAAPHLEYPRESFAHATAPDQYDPSSSIEDGSIFDEMMDEFDDFDGDESYDDGY